MACRGRKCLDKCMRCGCRGKFNIINAYDDEFSFLADTDEGNPNNLFYDNGFGDDFFGVAGGEIISFGGGDLGGTVDDNAAGDSVVFAGGTLTVNANGEWSFIGQPFVSGVYSFEYKVSNGLCTSVASVTIEIEGEPIIEVSPDSWNFGSTPLGTPVSKIFTINNTGILDLEITAISLPAGFTLTDPLIFPIIIGAGNNDTFTVEADADSVAIFSGDISIDSNAATSPTLIAIEVDVSAMLYADEFTGTVAAPIPAGNADTRGYRVVNDAESLMTIGSGVLNIPAQATAVWGDEYYRAQPSSGQQYWTRPTGKALIAVCTFNHSTRASQLPVGWWSNATLANNGNTIAAAFTNSNNILANQGSNFVSDNQTYSVSTDYQMAAVWTSWGFLIYAKIVGIWHLKWIKFDVQTQMYCGISNLNAVGNIDNFKIVAVDESLFNAALDVSNPSAGNLTNLPDGDFLLYLDNITRPSSGTMALPFRKKDASNKWQQNVTSAGAFEVYEIVNTTPTNRITGSGVVSTDDIITIARAQTIQAWRNTTALGSAYTSAYNFLREVGLELNSLGTGGAIARLLAWKARCLSESGLGSELVTNGSFTGSATGWTLGSGWAYGSNQVTKTAGISDAISQSGILTIGTYYEVTFTVSNYAGGLLIPLIGSSVGLAPISANGTYTVRSVCAGSTTLLFNASSTFAGSIDNVSCKPIQFTADSLATVLDGLAA